MSISPRPSRKYWFRHKDGDDSRRFCEKCQLHVQNIPETPPELAEQILSQGKTCIRAVGDSQRGIRTKDGWLPKLRVAGAVAATINGCAIMGSDETSSTIEPRASQPNPPVTGSVAVEPNFNVTGYTTSPTDTRIGKVAVPTPPIKTKSQKL